MKRRIDAEDRKSKPPCGLPVEVIKG